MFEKLPKPSREFIKRLLKAGSKAGRLVVESGHGALADNAAGQARKVREGWPDEDVERLVDRVVRAHLRLARSEGALAGASSSSAEVATIAATEGTTTLPAIAAITTADLAVLAWIQLRMTLIIAALYGHDPGEKARVREFLILQGALNSGPLAAAPISGSAQRMSKRLLLRYLRGPVLETLTSMFRTVGIKFSRAGLIRNLFLLNIPVNVAVNDGATRRLASKARHYYRDMPPSL